MGNFILVFTKEDKDKLERQGLKYMGMQGDNYLLRNDGNIAFSNDIVSIKANNITL